MTRYTATIATNQSNQDGDRFDDAALKAMAEQAPYIQVTRNFERPFIGSIISAKVEDGAVHAEIDGELPEGMYAVPGFLTKPGDYTDVGDVRVYHHVRLTYLGLTFDPSDPHLTPIRVKV